MIERFAERQVLRPLAEVARPGAGVARPSSTAEAVERLARDGVDPAAVEIRRRPVDLRLAGQDSSLLVEAALGAVAGRTVRRRLSGPLRLPAARPAARARVAARRGLVGAPTPCRRRSPSGPPRRRPPASGAPGSAAPGGEVPVFERARLRPGACLRRPGAGPRGALHDGGRARLAGPGRRRRRAAAAPARERRSAGVTPAAGRPRRGRSSSSCSPTASAASSGRWARRLRRTALSTNVKERLDFSCALLDADGRAGGQRAAHPGAPRRARALRARRWRDALPAGARRRGRDQPPRASAARTCPT